MAVYNYDVVVLGTGPAGEGAAMNAAKAGRKVAVVDNRPLVAQLLAPGCQQGTGHGAKGHDRR